MRKHTYFLIFIIFFFKSCFYKTFYKTFPSKWRGRQQLFWQKPVFKLKLNICFICLYVLPKRKRKNGLRRWKSLKTTAPHEVFSMIWCYVIYELRYTCLMTGSSLCWKISMGGVNSLLSIWTGTEAVPYIWNKLNYLLDKIKSNLTLKTKERRSEFQTSSEFKW